MSDEPEATDDRTPAKIALELMTHSDEIVSLVVVFRRKGSAHQEMLWSGLASKFETMGALTHALIALDAIEPESP